MRSPGSLVPREARGFAARAAAAAEATGQRLWLVGGTVRDALLGRPPRGELDLAVADPRRLLAALRLTAGESAFALDDGRDTFRVALPSRGDAAHVDIARLRAPTIGEDLRLRDFTVNAVAVALGGRGGRDDLLDPTGGVADCRRRLLRACGPRSMPDDPLRALRGVRLAANLGLRIAPGTLRMLAAARVALGRVSPERIRDELFGILQGPRPAQGAALALRLGLLRPVGIGKPGADRPARLGRAARLLDRLPARSALRRQLDEPLEQGVRRRGALLLAALLRDVGLDRRAAEACARLALGSRATRIVSIAAQTALPAAWYRRPAAAPREGLLDLHRQGDHAAAEAVLLGAPSAARALPLWRRYAAARARFARPPLLDGATAMRELGIAPGKGLGALLAAARRAQDLGRVRSLSGALRLARALERSGLVFPPQSGAPLGEKNKA